MTKTQKKKKKRVARATLDLTRAEAYALLAGCSAAIEACGGEPPRRFLKPLATAVVKFVDAFKFGRGDRS